ncbi:MAG: hypothetical protein OEV59_02735 [Deltaproteobacteria bacterium]|nr:hypothetical protein [Deltaproteobacteria bacterium]
METMNAEKPTGEQYKPIAPEGEGSLGMGIVGGLVAALIGGVVWVLVVVFTDTEVGIVAWGIGFICGLGVVFLGKGRGAAFQIAAVATSILGIAIGKYGAYYVFVRRAVIEEYGVEVLEKLSPLSVAMLSAFINEVPLLFGWFDILWVVLAVVTAWKAVGGRMPQAA